MRPSVNPDRFLQIISAGLLTLLTDILGLSDYESTLSVPSSSVLSPVLTDRSGVSSGLKPTELPLSIKTAMIKVSRLIHYDSALHLFRLAHTFTP